MAEVVRSVSSPVAPALGKLVAQEMVSEVLQETDSNSKRDDRRAGTRGRLSFTGNEKFVEETAGMGEQLVKRKTHEEEYVSNFEPEFSHEEGMLNPSLFDFFEKEDEEEDEKRHEEEKPKQEKEALKPGDKKDEVPLLSRPFPKRITPKVREYTSMDEFQSHWDQDEYWYAIEVFLKSDVVDAMALLDTEPSTAKKSRQARRAAEKTPRVERVRINSSAILALLEELGPDDPDLDLCPHTFQRPFRYFVHGHSEVKHRLDVMEKELAEVHSTPTAVFENSDIRQNAIEEIRCYVKFVDEMVMPDYNKFRTQDADKPESIRFSDLWYLFRVGELVYFPGSNATAAKPGHKESTRGRSNTEQRIWRVFRNVNQHVATGCKCESCTANIGKHPTTLSCYYIDHDSRSYGAVKKEVVFERYEKDRPITGLPVYPLHYASGWEGLLSEAKSFGKTFRDHMNPKKRQSFYNGWTLIRTPLGGKIETAGEVLRSPEHIESTVLIDFVEAFNLNPDWKPALLTKKPEPHKISYVQGDPIRQYSDSDGSNLKCRLRDWCILDDDVDTLEMNEFLKKDQFVGKIEDGEAPYPEDEDLALLPTRMFAYAIWDRKFVIIDVRSLHRAEQYEDKEDTFKMLQIPEQHKRLVESLIKSHFDRKRDEEANNNEIVGQDLIRGKGKGVVILLHGVPGVGKTATAEAVAERFNRPLFPITCGDLGSTAKDVEGKLNEIFRLAHLWNCVLLLDEAEVFISQRNYGDLKRNALVSVFLRMLEYYNGVLFLTTNRPGALDEAVKSRVHLNLQYDPLTKAQTKAIFELNIRRLEKIEHQRSESSDQHVKLTVDETSIMEFAEHHYDQPGHTPYIGRWNGRQIRNAFLIAASLAHFEGDEKRQKREDFPKLLNKTHFEMVEKTTKQYDKHRAAIFGRDDGERAIELEERPQLNGNWTHNIGVSSGHRQSIVQMPTPTGLYGAQQQYHSYTPLNSQHAAANFDPSHNGQSPYMGSTMSNPQMPPPQAPQQHNTAFANGTQKIFDQQVYTSVQVPNTGRQSPYPNQNSNIPPSSPHPGQIPQQYNIGYGSGVQLPNMPPPPAWSSSSGSEGQLGYVPQQYNTANGAVGQARFDSQTAPAYH